MFENINFPPIPSFKAQWKTIYFEPMPNSGERIAILILVRKTDQKIEIFDALHPTVIDSLYGSKSSSFQGFTKLIKNNIFNNNGNITSDIEGVYAGDWHDSQSTNINGIIRQALYKTASLGNVALRSLFESEDEGFENEQIDNRWSKRIKNEVLRIDPSYERSFDVKVPVSNEVRIKCGFHTPNYSAKFNVCTSQTIIRMKSNLFDLQILDTHRISNQFDLILYMPTDDDLQISSKVLTRMKENIHLLREEIASKSNINIYTCHSEREGAARIFEMLEAS